MGSKKGASEIEKLLEKQAHGEDVEGVPTEEQTPPGAELDKRRSKGGRGGGMGVAG